MTRFGWLLPALIALAGCQTSERPSKNDSQDPEVYARDVKKIAFGAVQGAKKSREPADSLAGLVTELSEQGNIHRPIGSYGPIYAELLALSKSLLADCQAANGKPSDLAPRLNAIQTVAEKLPG